MSEGAMKRALTLAAFLALSSSAAMADTLPSLAIAADSINRTVEITGASPGGDVVLVGCAQFTNESNVNSRLEYGKVLPADAAGRVQFTLPRVPSTSIWLAVDLTSGVHALATPPRYGTRPRSSPTVSLAHGAEAVLLDLPSAVTWLIRPGAGAWVVRSGRGGRNDDNPHKSEGMKVGTSHFKSITTAPAAPGVVRNGDLIFVIDPIAMESWLTQVDARMTSEAQRER